MDADALVDVLEGGFAVTNGDAPLEYTRNDALLQLAIDDGECLGPARYTPGICRVIRQFSFYQVSKVRLRPCFFDCHDLHQANQLDLRVLRVVQPPSAMLLWVIPWGIFF